MKAPRKDKYGIEVRGFITPIIELTVKKITGYRKSSLAYDELLEDDEKLDRYAQAVWRVDAKVLAFLVAEMLAYALVLLLRDRVPLLCVIPLAYVAWRIVNCVAIVFRVVLFDRRDDNHFVAAHERTILLGMVNYAELILCFGTVYAFFPQWIGHSGSPALVDWIAPLYLSAATLLTIGYGDIHPLSWLRPVAILQGAAGLIVLIFGNTSAK